MSFWESPQTGGDAAESTHLPGVHRTIPPLCLWAPASLGGVDVMLGTKTAREMEEPSDSVGWRM